MVNVIDIHKLNLEELSGVVNLYPWYGAARMELCRRMAGMGALTDSQLAEATLHVGSRRMLSNIVVSVGEADFTDADAQKLVEAYIPKSNGETRKVFVVGGDYFSQNQYDSVRRDDDNIFSRFAREAHDEGYHEPQPQSIEDYCTEALAKIYLEQNYPDEAISIYSKLSLRYPEKSVYFAALIDEINKKFSI